MNPTSKIIFFGWSILLLSVSCWSRSDSIFWTCPSSQKRNGKDWFLGWGVVGGGRNRSIPHSHRNYRWEEDGSSSSTSSSQEWLLWNPSRRIDADGFLSERYHCVRGEWEEEMEIRGKYGSRSKHCRQFAKYPVMVRQVPGDGNCLFHSLAAALSVAETGKHLNFTSSSFNAHNNDNSNNCFRSTSIRLRQRAIDVLSKRPLRKLFLQGNDYLRACDLVHTAASQYSITADEYCRLMRKDGYWGGGPEIVAISNALRRPIHIYELASTTTTKFVNPNQSSSNTTTTTTTSTSSFFFWNKYSKKSKVTKSFQLRRMACFGSPKFDFKEPLHILSADSRFPDISPGRQLSNGNHFLALFFPTPKMIREEERLKKKRTIALLRSGSTANNPTKIQSSQQSHKNHHHHQRNFLGMSCYNNGNFLLLFRQWLLLSAYHIKNTCHPFLVNNQ